MNKQEAVAQLEIVKQMIIDGCPHLDATMKYLQSIIEAAPESNWFVPGYGEEFYFISGSLVHFTTNYNAMTDKIIQNRDKVFRTSVEAERELDKRIATIKYLKAIAELNAGWKPDWNNVNQGKWEAVFDYKSDYPRYQWALHRKHRDNDWYSISQEAAEKAIACLTEAEIDLIFKS